LSIVTGSRLHREALLVFGAAAVLLVLATVVFQIWVVGADAEGVGTIWGTAFTMSCASVVVVAGAVYVRLISKRVQQLARGLEAVQSGQYPLLVVRGNDEISRLVVGFNQMVEELRARSERIDDWVDTKETELVQLKQTLDSDKEKLGTRLDNVGEGVIVLDTDGQVIMANQQVSDILGVPTAALSRVPLPALIEQVRPRLVNEAAVEQRLGDLRAGRPHAVDEMVLELDDSRGPSIRLYSTPVSGADADLLARIATLLDLGKAREVDRLKTEFLSTISHELRTPLTSVKGALGLVRAGAAGQITSDTRELLEIASANIDRLITVINNILDVLNLERGQAGFRFAPTPLADCVARAAGTVAADAQGAGVTVESRLPRDLATVHADPKRLEQVIVNLLSNAIKFSVQGQTVIVSAAPEGRKVKVSVQDSGKGISQEAIGRLFQKFEHSEGALTRSSQGAGLGLAICRHIVEAHGGRIWVESAEGNGSTFFFTLQASTPVDALTSRRSHRSVLVIDDDEATVRVISKVFEAQGHRVLASYSGEEAVQLVKRHRPDLVTLDLRMPRTDGYQVLDAIRRDPRTSALPVICISVEPDGGKALAGGANYYLNKPLDIDRLREISASVLERVGERV
jgi:signal transduction histidine kinase